MQSCYFCDFTISPFSLVIGFIQNICHMCVVHAQPGPRCCVCLLAIPIGPLYDDIVHMFAIAHKRLLRTQLKKTLINKQAYVDIHMRDLGAHTIPGYEPRVDCPTFVDEGRPYPGCLSFSTV